MRVGRASDDLAEGRASPVAAIVALTIYTSTVHQIYILKSSDCLNVLVMA